MAGGNLTDATTATEQARYRIICGTEEVGIATLAASHGEDLARSLSAASEACALVAETPKDDAQPHRWSATAECNVEDLPGENDGKVPRTPCTYNIAIAVAHDIAKKRKFASYGELHRLLDERTEYEPPEANAALAQWVGEVRTLPAPTEAEDDWADTFVGIFPLGPDSTAEGSV